MDGSQSLSRHSGEEKNHLALLAIESKFLGPSTCGEVATPNSDNPVPNSWKGQ
jgi:hypothetical protein